MSKPMMTAMKLTPLIRKHIGVPKVPMTKPASAGPMTRAPLKIELLSEIALRRSSRLVISSVKAWRAGMSKAIATPLMVAMARMIHGVASPAQASPARRNAGIICAVCVQRMIARFG